MIARIFVYQSGRNFCYTQRSYITSVNAAQEREEKVFSLV